MFDNFHPLFTVVYPPVPQQPIAGGVRIDTQISSNQHGFLEVFHQARHYCFEFFAVLLSRGISHSVHFWHKRHLLLIYDKNVIERGKKRDVKFVIQINFMTFLSLCQASKARKLVIGGYRDDNNG